MKVLFLLLAAAVAANRSIEYEPNTETSLWYESQTITHVPHQAEQMAGVKLRCRVNLQTKLGGRTTMQLSDVRLVKVLETVPEMTKSADDFLPQEWETELDEHTVRLYETELTKIVEFIFQDGMIRDLMVEASDPIWSRNIKKAILSMLQVKLRPDNNDLWQDEFVLNEEWKMDRSGEDMDILSDNNDQIFKSMETDVTGRCESSYNVRRDNARSTQTIHVTKSRNYRNCEFMPTFEQGIFSTLTVEPEIFENRQAIEKSNDADFIITDRKIEEVQQRSSYVHTPLNQERGSIVTTVIQRLTHKDTKSIEETLRSEGNMVQCENGLLFEFPISPIDQQLRKYDSDSSSSEESSESEDIIETISNLLTSVVSSKDRTSEANVDKVRLIGDLMSRLTVDKIKEICKNEIKPDQENRPQPTEKGEILLDLLPTLSTPKAFKALMSLITQRQISSTRAVASMNVLQFTITPNVEMIDEMISFMSNNVVREDKILKRTVWQTLPSIVYRLDRHARNVGVQQRRIMPFVNKFVEAFVETFKRCEERQDECTTTERIALIKGMGNMGISQMIPTIARILQDKSMDSKIRSEAARSLTKMPKRDYPRVIHIVMAVYMDRTDNTMVRQTCFISVIDCKPSLSILHLIVSTQRKETNRQVGSTVYSYCSTLIYAEMPSMKQLASNLRRVFPLIKVFAPYDFTKSKVDHRELVYRNFGIATTLEKFNLENTLLPSTLMAKFELNLLGQTFPVFSHGIQMKGLNGLLDNTIGISSGLRQSVLGKSLKEIFETILRPLQEHHVHLGSVAEEISTIIEKVGIIDREYFDKLNLAYTCKLFGRHLTFAEIDADQILNWIETGNLPMIGNVKKFISELMRSGKAFDMLKTFNLAKSTHQEPTSAGFPLSINHTLIAVVEAVGDISISGRSANLYVKPSYQHFHRLACGIDCGPVSTGVVLEETVSALKAPLNLKVDLDLEEKKLILTNTMPEAKQTVFEAEMTPKVFCSVIDSNKSIKPKTTKTLMLSHPSRVQIVETIIPTPTPFNFKITQKYIKGVSVPNWMPNPIMWSPGKMSYTFERLTSEPSTLELSYETTSSRSRAQQMLQSEVDPIIDSQDVHATKLTFRCGGRNSDSCKSTVIVIASSNWRKYQTKVTAELSSNPEYRFEGEIVSNTDSFRPSRLSQMNKNTVVNKLTCKVGSSRLSIKVFPDEPLSWNMYTQNTILNYLRQWTGEEPTVKIIKPVSSTPSTLNYRYEVDSDWRQEECSQCTYYKSVMVATALYVQNILPSIPLTNVRRLSSTPSQTQGQVKVIPAFQKVIATMKSTNGMEYDISIPAYLFTPVADLITLVKPVYTSDIIPHSYPSHWHKSHGYFGQSGRCSVHHKSGQNKDEVTTVDHKTYQLSDLPSDCQIVLAQDCSYKKLFTVIMEEQQQDKKMLTIYVQNFKIKMEPVSGWTSNSVQVIPSAQQIDEVIGGEVRQHNGWTSVVISKYGLTVSSNGKEIVVEVDSSYQNRMCGLCGNYNSHEDDEFTGPDMYHHSDRKIWLSTYVVSNDKCTPRSVRNHFGIEELSQASCDTPQEYTYVKSQGNYKCFSMEPLERCPKGCKPDSRRDIHRKTVPFTCLNARDSNTRRMVEECKYKVLDLHDYRVSERLEMEEPRRCVPIY